MPNEETPETGFDSQGLPYPSDQPRTVPTNFDSMTSDQKAQHNLGTTGAINPEPGWDDAADRAPTKVENQDNAQYLANIEKPYADTMFATKKELGSDSSLLPSIKEKLKSQVEPLVQSERERQEYEKERKIRYFETTLKELVNLSEARDGEYVLIDLFDDEEKQKFYSIMGVDFSRKATGEGVALGATVSPTRIPNVIFKYEGIKPSFEKNYREYVLVTTAEPKEQQTTEAPTE